ncbi:MAG: hypothetical protein GY765_29730 [bacterium]|nr:hypothetical protein [bacterium]
MKLKFTIKTTALLLCLFLLTGTFAYNKDIKDDIAPQTEYIAYTCDIMCIGEAAKHVDPKKPNVDLFCMLLELCLNDCYR